MDSLKDTYVVTYQFHNAKEEYRICMQPVNAESIGEALDIVDNLLTRAMDKNGWSDYHITNINIVSEMH